MADNSPFSSSSLSSALKTIPDGKRSALIVVADRSGAQLVVAARIGGDWKIAGEVGKPWDGPVSGKFTIMGSW